MNPGSAALLSAPAAMLLRHIPCLRYFRAHGMARFAFQMAAVAVGWQVYALTHSALMLGTVGVVQFLPAAGPVFFAGHVADRYPRKYVVMVCQLVEGAAAAVLALAVMGASDTISVVIRVSLVQLRTPDEMRGRVGAVNFLFVSASNQLGEFESGLAAALFGAVPAVVLGGLALSPLLCFGLNCFHP